MRYITVVEQSQSELDRVVTAHLKDGAVLQGGVAMNMIPAPSAYSNDLNIVLLCQALLVPDSRDVATVSEFPFTEGTPESPHPTSFRY